MKIDTKIRHVTKPGANLFLELGFTPDEAKRLQAASRQQINDARLLKQQLMEELSIREVAVTREPYCPHKRLAD